MPVCGEPPGVSGNGPTGNQPALESSGGARGSGGRPSEKNGDHSARSSTASVQVDAAGLGGQERTLQVPGPPGETGRFLADEIKL